MASENETVAEIAAMLDRFANGAALPTDEYPMFSSLSRRLLSAHGREVTELRECLKEACDSVCFKCRFGNTSYPYYCGNDCDRMAKWRKALEGANYAN